LPNRPQGRRGQVPRGRVNNDQVPPQVPAVVPPVPAPAPGGPVVPPPRVMIGYVAASNSWCPAVEADSKVAEYLKTLNITPRIAQTPLQDTNCHPRQAAERSIATARALGIIYASGYRAVTSVYGNERDVRINDYCNRQVANNQDQLRLVRYSPAVTSKDFSRNPTTITFADATQASQCLLMVDIYDTYLDVEAPLSPRVIAQMLGFLPDPFGGSRLVWVGRKFFGNAGIVANEGGWVRLVEADGAEKIWYRSSLGDPPEYVNDPLDWLWNTGSANVTVRGVAAYLTWTVRKVVGTFQIVSFNLTLGNLIETRPVSVNYPFEDNLVTIKCPSQSSLGRWWVPYAPFLPQVIRRFFPVQQEIKIYRPLLEIVRRALVGKKYNQTNYVLAATTLTNGLLRPEIKLFYDLFPNYVIGHNLNALVWGIILFDLKERENSNAIATGFHGESMSVVNDTQNKIGLPPSQSPSMGKQLFSVLVFLLGFYVLYRILRPRREPQVLAKALWVYKFPFTLFLPKFPVRSDNKIVSLVGGYLLDVADVAKEELIKKTFEWAHPNLYHVFGFLEFGEQVSRLTVVGGLRFALAMRLPALWLHYYLKRKNFKDRVLYHSVWNLLLAPCWSLAVFQFFPQIQRVYQREVVATGQLRCKWLWIGLAVTSCLLALRTLWCSWKTKPVDIYQQWKQRYFIDSWDSRSVEEDSNSDLHVIRDPRVPEQVSDLPLSLNVFKDLYEFDKIENPDHLLELSGVRVPDNKQETYFYHILPTNVPGFVPKACAKNLDVAIAYRLLKPPPVHPKTQAKVWQRWSKRWGQEFLSFLPNRVNLNHEWEDIVDKWIDHFRSSKKRQFYRVIVDELKKDYHNFELPKSTPLFVKHDEMLMQQQDGKFILKPRVIANVDPKYQARLGPYVYKVKEIFSGAYNIYNQSMNMVSFKTGGISPTHYHIATGGGMSDEDLSEWMGRVLDRVYVPPGEMGFAILACGDDSLVAYCPLVGDIVFYEGDASMFDQTISEGPLVWEKRVLWQMGLTQRMVDSLYDMHLVPYHARPHKNDRDQPIYVLGRRFRPMRDTGSAQTYLGNTIVMLSAWYFVLRSIQYDMQRWASFNEGNAVDLVKDQFLELGFSMKMMSTTDPMRVTFLKGMWYDVGERLCWGPLPSRILKVGKTLHDPRDMYGIKDMKLAGTSYLGDVASSYSVFLQVPILRAFVQRFNIKVLKHHDEASIPEYSTQASGNLSDLVLTERALASLQIRYDISLEELIRVENLIMRAEALNFMRDPVFIKLATVDYR
jgi:hypothetical protein